MGKGDKIKRKTSIFTVCTSFNIFYLFYFSIFSSLRRPHEAEEWRPGTWWQLVSVGIGPYRHLFQRESAWIGTNLKKKKKKTCTDMLPAASCTAHHVGCKCNGPRAAPVLSRITFTDLVTVVELCTIVGTFTSQKF